MSMILVLAIEDENINRAKRVLKDASCEIVVEDDLKAAIEEAIKRRPDLIVLDFTSPRELDGEAVFRRLKKDRALKTTPILAVLPEDRPQLLEAIEGGVGDFIFKPFRDAEFAARVKGIFRRLTPAGSDDSIKFGDLTIDIAKYEVLLGGVKIDLTFKEYELLKFLALNKGRVYSRAQLLDRIWGYDYYGGTRTVDVHIRRIRGKIEDHKHAFIETVHNIGYKFI